MNALVPPPPLEAYAPYRFTWEEVLRMAEAGLFERDDGWRVELIEGELIAVPPQSLPHIRWKSWLNILVAQTIDKSRWRLVPDAPIVADDRSGPEPDLYLYPAAIEDRDMRPTHVVLAIEVAVSSQRFDLKKKARLYAEAGVQEYWVADVPARRFVVHRGPHPDGSWTSIESYHTGKLSPQALPELTLHLDDLPPSD